MPTASFFFPPHTAFLPLFIYLSIYIYIYSVGTADPHYQMTASSSDTHAMLGLLNSSTAERVAAQHEYMWQVVEGGVAMLALEEATTRKEISQRMRHEGRLLELLTTVQSPPTRSSSSLVPPVTRSAIPSRSLRVDAAHVSAEELEALWALEKTLMQRKINELRTRIATIELGHTPN